MKMNYQETVATLKGLFPGHDEKTLNYAIQRLDEQVKRARDFHKTSEERWFQLGNSFKVVAEYAKWLNKQRFYGVHTPSSLEEDFTIDAPLFNRFLEETGVELY